MSIAPKGQDIRFSRRTNRTRQKFCNKLWNVSRFRLQVHLEDNSLVELIVLRIDLGAVNDDDKAILLRLVETLDRVEKLYEEFEFNAVLQSIYKFFWNDFAIGMLKLQNLEFKTVMQKTHALLCRIFV